MAAPVDDSKIIVPYMPSLFHLARVKIAASLFAHSIENIKRCKEFCDNKKVEQKLLVIPKSLRKSVLEAFNGMVVSYKKWQETFIEKFHLENENITLHWRPEGTVDACKIVEELLLNENIDIKNRFMIACMNWHEKTIQTLWVEMEVSGESKSFLTNPNCVIRFWIRWLRNGSKVPWIEFAREYFDSPDGFYYCLTANPNPRFSSLFPLLPLRHRFKCMKSFEHFELDDLRFSIYTMTIEEVEQILDMDAVLVLQLYLTWPLQNFFLEIAEKLWKYMNNGQYCMLLRMLYKKTDKKDFDYFGLLTGFWNISPENFKEVAENDMFCEAILDAIKGKPAVEKVGTMEIDQTRGPLTRRKRRIIEADNLRQGHFITFPY